MEKPRSKKEKAKYLRQQFEALLEEDRRRRERNEDILRRFDRMRRADTHVIKITPDDCRHFTPTVRILSPNSRTNIRPDQKNAAAYPLHALVPKQNNSTIEQTILRELSKNYILIPKIHREYVYADKEIGETLPTQKDEWKSKYDILNKINMMDQMKDDNTPEKDTKDIIKDSVVVPNVKSPKRPSPNDTKDKVRKFGVLEKLDLKSYNMVRNADIKAKMHDQRNQNNAHSDSDEDISFRTYASYKNLNDDITKTSNELSDITRIPQNSVKTAETKIEKIFHSNKQSANDPQLPECEENIFSTVLADTKVAKIEYLSKHALPEYLYETPEKFELSKEVTKTADNTTVSEISTKQKLLQSECPSAVQLLDQDHNRYTEKVKVGNEEVIYYSNNYSPSPVKNEENSHNELGNQVTSEGHNQDYDALTEQSPHDVNEDREIIDKENISGQYMQHNLPNNTQNHGGRELKQVQFDDHRTDQGQKENQNMETSHYDKERTTKYQNEVDKNTHEKVNITKIKDPEITIPESYQNDGYENQNVDEAYFQEPAQYYQQHVEQQQHDEQSVNPDYKYQAQSEKQNIDQVQYPNGQNTSEQYLLQNTDLSQYQHPVQYADPGQYQYLDQYPPSTEHQYGDSEYKQNYDQPNGAHQDQTQGQYQGQQQETSEGQDQYREQEKSEDQVQGQYLGQEQGQNRSQEHDQYIGRDGQYQDKGQEQCPAQDQEHYQSQEQGQYQSQEPSQYQNQEQGQYQSQELAEYQSQEQGQYQSQEPAQYQSQEQYDENYLHNEYVEDQGHGKMTVDPEHTSSDRHLEKISAQ